MDWIYAHLVVNHFPIILAVIASLAAAVATPIAFLTGRQAEEVAESLPICRKRRSSFTSTGGCTR